MSKIRAKFRCNSVEFFGDPTSADAPRNYTMSPVYDTMTPENERFAKATPWGELKMSVMPLSLTAFCYHVNRYASMWRSA